MLSVSAAFTRTFSLAVVDPPRLLVMSSKAIRRLDRILLSPVGRAPQRTPLQIMTLASGDSACAIGW